MHSDSESLSPGKPTYKRQKIGSNHASFIDEDVTMVDVEPQDTYEPNKNAHLKGRRRFNADLADIEQAAKAGLVLNGLQVKKVRAGDDEGSIEVVLEKTSSEHVLSVNLLISDTSEYPGSHSVFCYSPDGDLSAKLQRIVDEIAEEPPRSIGATVKALVASVARVVFSMTQKVQVRVDVSDEESEGSDDYDAFEDYDDIVTAPMEADSVMAKLQQDFVDIVATEYKPGFIRLNGNDFVLSISLPVVELANSIPPRALMAWDRRLLSCSQYLTLLISGFRGLYPVLESDGFYTASAQRLATTLTFKVGLSEKYKPGKDQVQEVVRKHGLIIQDAEDELRIQAELEAAQKAKYYDWEDDFTEDEPMAEVVEEVEVADPGRFDRFSMSSSLESLMDASFLKLVQLRRKFGLGWAGAELLHAEIEKSQMKDQDVLFWRHKEITNADGEERELSRTTNLPHDPLIGLGVDQPFNLPLTAFCYLVRRLSLCPRYCIVCHNKLQTDYEALKPYVCDSKLCSYQYYTLNRGPSLEYEIIHNPQTVDLLVSLAFCSASDGSMEDPFPVGLGLRVPVPSASAGQYSAPTGVGHQNPQPVESPRVITPGTDGLCDFDELLAPQMRNVIAKLINMLPSIDDMKKHLERKVKAGKSKPKLKDIDSNILPAAWSILRWCVASCTAHIEAITSSEDMIKNLDPTWRQFRMTVGAPDAEARFMGALEQAKTENANAQKYPVIYLGVPWFPAEELALGVYLAKDAQTSMSYYAQSARSAWQKSQSGPTNCMALAEVVNLPNKFVSSNPHYVIKDTHWIMCRYLLVKGIADAEATATHEASTTNNQVQTPFVKLDPHHKTAVSGKAIEIPDPAFKVESLLAARNADYVHEDPDKEDLEIFSLDQSKSSKAQAAQEPDHYGLDDDDDFRVPATSSKPKQVAVTKPNDDWKHDEKYVTETLENLMLPPFQSSPSASMAIQRELKSMLKEQEMAPSLRDLGWYMPPALIGDNLYQWIVEMHSLDPALPIAKDLKIKKINSIIFEIRFPPTFPNSPPFFRIITPRFLPFIHGGGGHVTGGGSICMDLLTTDGWLPSYSISAILMQIRLAISNLEPRPARLAPNWNTPYGIEESLVGYKRAAATHNWTIVSLDAMYTLEPMTHARVGPRKGAYQRTGRTGSDARDQTRAQTTPLTRQSSAVFDFHGLISTSTLDIYRNRLLRLVLRWPPLDLAHQHRNLMLAACLPKPSNLLIVFRQTSQMRKVGPTRLRFWAMTYKDRDLGNTLLMLAAYAGHIELTKGLLDRGGDPNRINDLGQSMIAGAVFKAHNDIVHALMTKGADPRLGTPNAIQTAHMFGRKDLMEVLGARDEDLKDVPGPFPVPGS
ncbi:hypothetical protein NLJ89_g5227 [Agrocybe chaxingu]|uniref:UBC core domain-containing protein n=1 Tax=Agrocybe chaxingu TaxID=84603 RepID=A0A9W8K108_9AGAR|nr:hypothetical protein NLJ89_g5227 [Agrocybe chaxingu]